MSLSTSSTRRIAAAQLIYTNVEAEESPHKIGGFQTVFWSDRLDEDEIKSEIEPRLRRLKRAEPETEAVFFRTSRGHFVIGRITPLLNEQDSLGRKKVMFAHSLILEAKDFRYWGYNPFLLFDSFPFATGLDEVRKETGTLHGYIAPVELDPSKNTVRQFRGKLADQLDWKTFIGLLRLAVRAQRADKARVILGCTAPATQMMTFLRDLFDLLPATIRAYCSFDTLFADTVGQTKGNDHLSWAIGFSRGVGFRDDRNHEFDLETFRFTDPEKIVKESGLFETWLNGLREQPVGTPQLINEIAWAYELSESLDRRLARSVSSQAATFVSLFLDSIRPQIEDRIRSQLNDQNVGPELSKRLMQPLFEQARSSAAGVVVFLSEPFNLSSMAEWLVDQYMQSPGMKPSENELNELFPLVTECNAKYQAEVLLDSLYSYWRQDWHRLAKAIEWLENEEYARFIHWCLASRNDVVEWEVTLNNQGDIRFGPIVQSQKETPPLRPLIAALLGGIEDSVSEASVPKPGGQEPRTRFVFKEITSGMPSKWPLLSNQLATLHKMPTCHFDLSQVCLVIGNTAEELLSGRCSMSQSSEERERTVEHLKQDTYLNYSMFLFMTGKFPELSVYLADLDANRYRRFANWAIANQMISVGWRATIGEKGELRFGPMLERARCTNDQTKCLAALLGASDVTPQELASCKAKRHWPILMELLAEHGDQERRR